MEEKKLTDEATIDSLKEMAIKFSKDTYVNRVLVNAINLIHRLQYENERLKCNSYKTSWKAKFFKTKAEIETLKKDYIELDLECRELRTELDKELADHEEFTKKAQEEIERLTEELDLANETIDRNNKRYEKVSIERQKALDRVDYLEDALLEKIRRNEELITAIKQAEQQAVKDTAKEICDLILEHWEKKQFVECDWLRVTISERYGVEVE